MPFIHVNLQCVCTRTCTFTCICICIATVHRVMTSYDAVCRECISKILIFQRNWRECKFSKMLFNSLVTRLIMCADVVCTLMTQSDVSREQESEKISG